jgi:hypothetical protein
VRSDSEFCHNCGIRLNGRFCSACGQKALPLNVTFHDFFHDFTHEMLHVDGRIFQSFRGLLLSPGFLTREYLLGHRARWISPIRLYLIASVIFFALSAFVPLRTAFDSSKQEGWNFSWGSGPRVGVTGSDDEDADAMAKELGFENENALNAAVNHALIAWLPRVMFVLLPLFAWFVAVAYRRVDRNYLHHLIFALHVHAAFFTAAALATLATLVSRPLGALVWLAVILYTMTYVILGFRGVYGKVRHSFVRIALVLFVYWVVTIIAFVAIVVPVVVGPLL